MGPEPQGYSAARLWVFFSSPRAASRRAARAWVDIGSAVRALGRGHLLVVLAGHVRQAVLLGEAAEDVPVVGAGGLVGLASIDCTMIR